MNSKLVIAAGASLLVLLALVGGFILLTQDNEDDPRQDELAESTDGEAETLVSTETDRGSNTRKIDASQPVERGSVEVEVEVRDAQREGLLSRGTKVRAWRVTEGDRMGDEVDLPEVRGGTLTVSLKPGSYEFLAQSRGFTGQRQARTFSKGQSRQKLVFRLERGHSIAGKVVDERGRGIPGADVYAFKELTRPNASLEDALRAMTELEKMQGRIDAQTTTDQDGEFRLDGLESFWFSVRATADDFAPRQLAEVKAPKEGLVIELQPGARLEGFVRNQSGQGIEGANVQAYEEVRDGGLIDIIMNKSRPAVGNVFTGSDGSYSMTSLGAGVYNFIVVAPGYQEYTEMRVRVDSGSNPGRDFMLEEGRRIVGIVQGPENEPIVGAKVRANALGVHKNPKDEVRIKMGDNSITTDDQGRFAFTTLDADRYMLLVSHEDYESLQRKDIQPSDEDVTLTLDYGGRLAGEVRDALTGQPLVGATVSCTDVSNLRKEDVTDENGLFVVSGLGSGRRPINVYVRADGYARVKRQVTVRKGQEQEQNFELQPTGSVFGEVVNSNGDVVVGAHIEVRPDPDSGAALQILGNGMSDRQGLFAIQSVEPGERLFARIRADAYLDVESDPFDIEANGEVDLGRIVLQLGGEISGEVVDEEGRPIIGAWIDARPEGETELTNTVDTQPSDRKGKFHLRGLEAGLYDIYAKANGYVEGRTSRIEVREGQVNHGHKIVLTQGGHLSGVVTSAGGEPVAGAQVIVRDFGDGIAERRAISDPKGHFEFNNIVSEENVEVEVSHDDYATWNHEAVAVGTTDLEVELTSLSSVIGVVLDPSGKPVGNFTVQPQLANRRDGSSQKRFKAKTFNKRNGQFEYKGLSAGTYTFFVRSIKYSAVTIEGVLISEGETKDLGEIHLQEGGTVTGHVIDAGSGEPIAGARIRITQGARAFRPGKSRPSATTDADGYFSFTGLKDQVLTFEVSADGFATIRETGIDPRVASKSQGLELEMVTASEVYGAVVDDRKQALANINVYLIHQGKGGSKGANKTASTDKDGNFHFRGVAPGSYIVKAHKFDKPPRTSEQAIQVESGSNFEVLLQLD